MGHAPSRPQPKGDGFTGVLPAHQSSSKRRTSPQAEAPALVRPVETTVETAIPEIHAPAHALLRHHGGSGQPRPETPRRYGRQEEDAIHSVYAVPESVRKSQTLTQFEQTCSEIVPGFLFVSNLQVAQNVEMRQALGITHVVNCCKEVVCFDEDSPTTSFLQLALRDGVQEDLLPFFPQVIQFLESAQGAKVLIHCHQGISRSCAFAIAYVMYMEPRCGFQSAIARVKAQRAICSPNAAFICQLIEWERELAAAAAASSVVVEATTSAVGWQRLYRLAPHASYDGSTLVLKLCYHKDSRRKIALDASGLPNEWLFSRGIFVYLDHERDNQIVIWKGHGCVIQDAVEKARRLVQQMLQVYAGEAVAQEMALVVIDQQDRVSDELADVDYFGYATELAWWSQENPCIPPSASIPSSSSYPPQAEQLSLPPGLGEAQDLNHHHPSSKPQLFLLDISEDASVWEQLNVYDSDDLSDQNILLLIHSKQSYLWIGQDHAALPVDSLRIQAAAQIAATLNTSETGEALHEEYQDQESDNFWEAFEAGY